MRKIRLQQLVKIAAENVYLSEVAIINLIDAFERGTIKAAAARRLYRAGGLRENYRIDYERYSKLCNAFGVGCCVSELDRYDNYFIY